MEAKKFISELCEATKGLFGYIKIRQQSLTKKSEHLKSRSVIKTTEGRHTKLEDTVRSRFEYLLNCDLPEVRIHIGGKEQETLREAGAVALTQVRDIYIREESYKEGSEETEKILLHELTHVVQRLEGRRISEYEEIAEAEREAAANEQLAEYEADPYYYAKINGKLFYINNKIARQAVRHAVNGLAEKAREFVADENFEMLIKLNQVIEGKI